MPPFSLSPFSRPQEQACSVTLQVLQPGVLVILSFGDWRLFAGGAVSGVDNLERFSTSHITMLQYSRKTCRDRLESGNSAVTSAPLQDNKAVIQMQRDDKK